MELMEIRTDDIRREGYVEHGSESEAESLDAVAEALRRALLRPASAAC